MNEDKVDAKASQKRPIAIALAYDPDIDDAPKVVAHGKGEMAERILKLAFETGVRVREDADLVQILSAVDIDQAIPSEAFWAVAEILAYVYNANQQVSAEEKRP